MQEKYKTFIRSATSLEQMARASKRAVACNSTQIRKGPKMEFTRQ